MSEPITIPPKLEKPPLPPKKEENKEEPVNLDNILAGLEDYDQVPLPSEKDKKKEEELFEIEKAKLVLENEALKLKMKSEKLNKPQLGYKTSLRESDISKKNMKKKVKRKKIKKKQKKSENDKSAPTMIDYSGVEEKCFKGSKIKKKKSQNKNPFKDISKIEFEYKNKMKGPKTPELTEEKSPFTNKNLKKLAKNPKPKKQKKKRKKKKKKQPLTKEEYQEIEIILNEDEEKLMSHLFENFEKKEKFKKKKQEKIETALCFYPKFLPYPSPHDPEMDIYKDTDQNEIYPKYFEKISRKVSRKIKGEIFSNKKKKRSSKSPNLCKFHHRCSINNHIVKKNNKLEGDEKKVQEIELKESQIPKRKALSKIIFFLFFF